MRKKVTHLIRKKWFPAAAAAAVLCVAAAVYTGVSGHNNIVTRAVNTALMPAQRAVTHTAVNVADTYNRVFRYDDLKAENEELKQQVTELTRQLNDVQQAEEENESLRDLLGFSERHTEFSYAEAEVVGCTLDEWSSVLSLNAGSAEGLEEGDCVVTAQGNMVGYLSEVSEHAAQVTTVIDSNMSAGVRVVRTDALAVAQGDYQLMQDGKLKVSYLSKDADVVIGDTVQTSGTGGVFPEALGIGTVESIRTESDGMSNYAVLTPLVDLTTLTRVYIITEITYD